MNGRSWIPLLLLLLAFLLIEVGCYRPYKLVMVMNFQNSTGEPNYVKLESAIPEYLMTHMSEYEGIRFLERQDAQPYIQNFGLVNESTFNSRGRWKELGNHFGADYLIAGSVSKLDKNFIIVARMFSVEKGIVIPGSAIVQRCQSEEDIYLKTQLIAQQLRSQIMRRSMPLESAPYYREGTPASPAISTRAAGAGP